ncbi:Tyrosine kinase [Handroanthus impetiginosus]|uniref:non-specific serine/threonine protein kinase n=1 Tax=Handroanthus impetiginosus TaxID=429701 RepID=A0A2G9GB50_9LAMI|nr:Tyrosine kinase [Handroanthus impetiginosus]
MQLAMAISVSDTGQACVDSETAQINAVKQISLGRSPSQSLAEFLSFRYWSCNVVNYDEKVMDGFYDICGIDSNLPIQVKMPPLVDLEAISVVNNVGYEVVSVNRAVDMELRKLEERVYVMSTECRSLDKGFKTSFLVQKIAELIVERMGGPVSDVEEMLRRWRARNHELSIYFDTIILPLGSLDVGHSRQRALLFKVLADRIDLPCKLVKGSYYTGTDEGAVNLIKLDSGSEYIIDLMGAPGTLIPAEAPSGHLQNFGSDARTIATVALVGRSSFTAPDQRARIRSSSPSEDETAKTRRLSSEFSSIAIESNIKPGRIGKIQTDQLEHDIGDIFLPSVGAGEQSLHAGKETIGGESHVQDVTSRRKRPGEGLGGDQFKPGASGYKSSADTQGKQNVLVTDRMDEVIPNDDAAVGSELVDFTRYEEAPEVPCTDQSDANKNDNVQISPVLNGVAEILWEDLQIGERIGIGSYGEVYRAEWNGTEVAVKKFMKQDISGDALAQYKCEVEIMLRLRHPNIVLLMGAVIRPPNMSILTEFLPRGSLYKLLHRLNIQIDEKRRIKMALDVAKGMNYLHTSHPIIVHRDLKSPNLLVDKNWVVKVCDFGMSRLQHHTFLSSKSAAGTAEWMAPELLRNEPSNEKSDVYSFGVILWELATLKVPWTEMNSMQVVGAVGFQGRHLDIPPMVDPLAAGIISDCWNRNPQARPSFAQIISRLKCLQHLCVQKR